MSETRVQIYQIADIQTTTAVFLGACMELYAQARYDCTVFAARLRYDDSITPDEAYAEASRLVKEIHRAADAARYVDRIMGIRNADVIADIQKQVRELRERIEWVNDHTGGLS